MIRFSNGTQRTRSYESMGEHAFNLEQASINYKAHLDLISKDIFKRFSELKEDYNKGLIDQGTYWQFLKPLKELLERNQIEFREELNVGAILAELNKQFK